MSAANYEQNRAAAEHKSAYQKPYVPQALYLRIDDLNTDMYRRAKRVTDIFDGRTPIIFILPIQNAR